MINCSFKYFFCCSTLLQEIREFDDMADAVDEERDGVEDLVECVEELKEKSCAELHLDGNDFSWPIL
jgi:hypothetical protein